VFTRRLLVVTRAADREGFQPGTPDEVSRGRGLRKGWAAGYAAAVAQVMGQLGTSARRADEDEPITPAC